MNRAFHFLLTLFITLQLIMQPVQGAVHGGDAFETHKPHRTTSAAIGGRSGGAGCASGAVGGIAQSLYSKSLAGKGPRANDFDTSQAYQEARSEWQSEIASNASVLGALAGFAFSGGEGGNVSSAGNIAASGIRNNYLKHDEALRINELLSKGIRYLTDEEFEELSKLQQVDKDREDQLKDCKGSASASCVTIRQELRIALAEYVVQSEKLQESNFSDGSLQRYAMNRGYVITHYGTIYGSDKVHGDLSSDPKLDPAEYKHIFSGEAKTEAQIEAQIIAKQILNGERLDPNLAASNAYLMGLIGPGGAAKKVNANGTKYKPYEQRVAPNKVAGSLTDGQKAGILREASNLPSGNRTLAGSASRAEATELGQAWVGPGYKTASDGKTLVSADGLRQYRPPSPKPNSSYATTGTQANFQQKLDPSIKTWTSNAHLNISD